MAKVTEMPGEDFSKERSAILTVPTNNVPPITEGLHPYMAHKMRNIAEPGDLDMMAIIDPWGDSSTDFKQLAGYLAPVLQNSVTGTMGGRKILLYTQPTVGRIVMKQVISFPTKKWTFSAVYTVNNIEGGSGNRCLFSFVDKNYTQYLCIYATTTSAGPAKIIVGKGSISPLAVNTAPSVSNNIDFTLLKDTKEVFSYVYDGTLFGGTFNVYRNGVLLVTLNNIGVFSLEGDAYLGTDVRSGTNSSDFKGEIGNASIAEYALLPEEVAALHIHLNKAFI